MSDELWNKGRIEAMVKELNRFKDLVTISGGYAWHFMSPPHEEKRSFHDHKDIDIFIKPDTMLEFMMVLNDRPWKDYEVKYERQWTKYDGKSKDFYRYTAYVDNQHPGIEEPIKVMLDVFVRDIPSIPVSALDGTIYNVVDPVHLLPLYEHSHSSKDCVAVQAAMKLVAKGISPVGRPELIGGK